MHHGILIGKQDGDCMEDANCSSWLPPRTALGTRLRRMHVLRVIDPLNQTNLSLISTFKHGLIVLKLAKNSSVIHLPLDSVVDVENRSLTANGTGGSEPVMHVTLRGLQFSEDEEKPQS